MPLLEAQNVSYVYKGKNRLTRAVNSVTAAFDPGFLYIIMGKSGSGKTTFLSLLAGLDSPSEGSIFFRGTDICSLNKDAYRRSHIAMIYQLYNLFPHLNVLENVMLPLLINQSEKKAAECAAIESLALVGLHSAFLKRKPGMLSGGEQQRTAIARALAGNSDVILADEPTGNLDIENSQMIASSLVRIAHEKEKCVIMVTHDILMADYADHRLVMRDGRIFAD